MHVRRGLRGLGRPYSPQKVRKIPGNCRQTPQLSAHRAIQSGLGPGVGRWDITARLAALEDAGIHPNPVEAGMVAGYPPPEV